MSADIKALTIGPGSTVTMHFRLSLKDGTVADETLPDQPMTFAMGDGSMIEGLELALYGLKVGDKQSLEIGPHDAFGFPDEDNVHNIPREEFDPSIPLTPGTIINFSTPNGTEVAGTVRDVHEDHVAVDFNHPLAGLPVIFAVEILEIKAAK